VPRHPECPVNQALLPPESNVPGSPLIIVLGQTVADGMTITTPVFESHLKYLKSHGYTVIPLKKLTDYYLKKCPAPSPGSVVIVEDDAHKSVYSEMAPLVKKYNVPVTVFVYPSAISNASYAMTWDQIRELKKTGLFDFQSHTYWHPNFKKEAKRLKPAEYEKFVEMQLAKSKQKIEKETGGRVNLLAWPFGIYDDFLGKKASEAGYSAAFTINAHHATSADSLMRLPRYLLINSDSGEAFARIVAGVAPVRNITY